MAGTCGFDAIAFARLCTTVCEIFITLLLTGTVHAIGTNVGYMWYENKQYYMDQGLGELEPLCTVHA